MTLCIAWKGGGTINFASDSRLTIKTSKVEHGKLKTIVNYSDVGIKVFSIPVKIYSAYSSESQQRTLDYDHTIGLCFAGYTTNAYVVKETIFEILQQLQYSPYTNFSMAGICKMIAKFYSHTSQKLCEFLAKDGIAEFFIAGFCPMENKIRTFKFFLDTSTHPIQGRFLEILTTSDVEFLGSGFGRASNIHANAPKQSIFKVLKQVIDEDSTPDVGGNIQYGSFHENHNFEISGVEDYTLDKNGFLKPKLLLRGTQLYENDIISDYDDFVISYSFIRPFQSEINKHLNRTINNDPS